MNHKLEIQAKRLILIIYDNCLIRQFGLSEIYNEPMKKQRF